jgi:methionyl aminopeptidase
VSTTNESAEELARWRVAGRIAAEARELGATQVKVGALRKDVAEAIEGYIRAQGAQPAFPANLSRNVEAAHYTPSLEDDVRFIEGDLVKVDVGAHLDGAIADTAVTVEVGATRRHENMIRAVKEAVEAGIARVRPGVPVEEVSVAIQEAIHARGLKPIEDLTGHTIQRYLLHAGKSIPNVAGRSGERLEEGEFVAIEPFATNGRGSIEDGPFGNIVRFRENPGPSDPVLAALFDRFRTLPFTGRWAPAAADQAALRRFRRRLQSYPIFLERAGGIVAQAEHTVRVGPGGAEVLTRSPT